MSIRVNTSKTNKISGLKCRMQLHLPSPSSNRRWKTAWGPTARTTILRHYTHLALCCPFPPSSPADPRQEPQRCVVLGEQSRSIPTITSQAGDGVQTKADADICTLQPEYIPGGLQVNEASYIQLVLQGYFKATRLILGQHPNLRSPPSMKLGGCNRKNDSNFWATWQITPTQPERRCKMSK